VDQSRSTKSGSRRNVSEETMYADRTNESADTEIKKQELTVETELNEPTTQPAHVELGEATSSDYIVSTVDDDDDYLLEPSCD
jgi:hypothetical protein